MKLFLSLVLFLTATAVTSPIDEAEIEIEPNTANCYDSDGFTACRKVSWFHA